MKTYDLLVIKRFVDKETGELHETGKTLLLRDKNRVKEILRLKLCDVMGIYNENE